MEENSNKYILGIVGIVAVVGMFILFLGGGAYNVDGYAVKKVSQPGLIALKPDVTMNNVNFLVRVYDQEGNIVRTKSAHYGGVINLDKEDANFINELNQCAFDIEYSIKNVGRLQTGEFLNHIWTGGFNELVSQQSVLRLNPGETRELRPTVYLSGNKKYLIQLDDTNAVRESNENNNQFSIQLNVDPECNPFAHVVGCIDTDGGAVYIQRGDVTGRLNNVNGIVQTVTDTCISPDKLIEYFCVLTPDENLFVGSEIYDCVAHGRVCREGRCTAPGIVQ